MKREFLKDLGLEDEVINKIMTENGKDIEKHKTEKDAYKTKYDDTKKLLDDANTTIQSYKDMDVEGIKKSAEDWKTKYETDTAALNNKIAQQEYEHQADKYLNKYEFSSNLVRSAVLNQFKEKNFKLENDTFLGADDFMKQLQESEPGIFKVSNPAPGNTGGAGNHPRVGGGAGAVTKADILKMPYSKRVEFYNNNKEEFNRLMNE